VSYFEKMIMDKIGGHNGGPAIGEYKKYISGLKESISHSFEKKNIDKTRRGHHTKPVPKLVPRHCGG